jgi:hypothetical protein
MIITIQIFSFYILLVFKKKTNAHTKKNICIHTSDNTRGVHNLKKFQRKQKKGEALLGTRSYYKQKRFYLYIPERYLDIDTHTHTHTKKKNTTHIY